MFVDCVEKGFDVLELLVAGKDLVQKSSCVRFAVPQGTQYFESFTGQIAFWSIQGGSVASDEQREFWDLAAKLGDDPFRGCRSDSWKRAEPLGILIFNQGRDFLNRAYHGTKGFLDAYPVDLAEEFKEEGITVNALAIGTVQTEMLAEAFPDYKAPLDPPQMARFMKWFTLEGAGYFNGKILPVSVASP